MPNSHAPIEILSELGREYRRLREVHEKEGAQGSRRRHTERDMHATVEHFERMLSAWVSDESLRKAWRDYLYSGDEAPLEPRVRKPPFFRGRTTEGAVLEVRAASDGGYDLFLDQALVDHQALPWHLDPETVEPIHIGAWQCFEIFESPEPAIEQLEAFLAGSASTPPWTWARVLFDDGLIDGGFALTARGARCLRNRQGKERAVSERTAFCVLLADSSRARILMLSSKEGYPRPIHRLHEIADWRNPQKRARDSERYADSRSGRRRGGGRVAAHSVDDRRQSLHVSDRLFIRGVVEGVVAIFKEFPNCQLVIVANPRMLGLLRPAIARHRGGPSLSDIIEFSRDLTQMSAPAVHEALAKAGFLPGPGRLAPVLPMRTPNPWQS